MRSLADNIKSIIIVGIVVFLSLLSGMRLMEIQVVGDKDIKTPSKYGPNARSYVHQVKATRGAIIDYNGNLIVGNKARCDLVLRKAYFPEDNKEGNASLLGIYNELKKRGYEIKETIPITKDRPYVFTKKNTEKLISDLNLNVYASAENCIDKLISDYEIDDSYTDEEKRIIAGLRYEMTAQDFSYEYDMLLAKDVDEKTVVEMKEMSNFYKGIDAIESYDRTIERGDILPHEIGTVGPIYAEEYEELKTKGYALNDQLGKSGIEAAMENQLRGVNGEEEIVIEDGEVIDTKTLTHTETGATVKLTVDGNFQLKLQNILQNFIDNFPSINPKPGILDAKKGAIAVIDVKTGAVKGLATAPTYNLKDYSENYDYFLKAKNSPLLNRCTWGLYRPGSTFKTITATAGLNEGVVSGDTAFPCKQVYWYHGSKYGCTGYHGYISVRRAIEVSCNSYFYELSSLLGIDNITRYAKLYGLGSSTGIETGDAAGYLCNPETFAANNIPWYIGYVIQAGIGNQDAGMTPLQMAVVASTIANKGVRYKPYLVDSLYEYGSGKQISQTQPTIAEKIQLNHEDVYDYIIGGMMDAAKNVPANYSLSNLGYSVAIKTGTPQTGANLEKQNSFFIGFAPADNPEVAFAGVIEDGEYSKYMIRDILLAYQECYGLNGVKPNITDLPKEVRPVLTTVPEETTNTATSTTTTTTNVSDYEEATTTTLYYPIPPVYTQPIDDYTPPTEPITPVEEPATQAVETTTVPVQNDEQSSNDLPQTTTGGSPE